MPENPPSVNTPPRVDYANPGRALTTVREVLRRGITANSAGPESAAAQRIVSPRPAGSSIDKDLVVIRNLSRSGPINNALSGEQVTARLAAAYDVASACLTVDAPNRRGFMGNFRVPAEIKDLKKYVAALENTLSLRPGQQGKIDRSPRLPNETRAVTLRNTTEERLKVLDTVIREKAALKLKQEGPQGNSADIVEDVISFYEDLAGARPDPVRRADAVQEEPRSPSPDPANSPERVIEGRENGVFTNEQVDALGGEETVQALSESLSWPVDIDPYAPEFVSGLRELIAKIPSLRRAAGSNEYSFLVVKPDSVLMEFDFDQKTRKVKLGKIYIPDLGDIETYHNTSALSAEGSERIDVSKRRNNQGERQLGESHVHPDSFYDRRKNVAHFSGTPQTAADQDADYGAMKRDQRDWFKTGERPSLGGAQEFMDRIAHLAERGNMVVNLPTSERSTLLFTTMYHTVLGVQINEYVFDPQKSDSNEAITLVDAYGQDTPDSYIMPTSQMLQYYQQTSGQRRQ